MLKRTNIILCILILVLPGCFISNIKLQNKNQISTNSNFQLSDNKDSQNSILEYDPSYPNLEKTFNSQSQQARAKVSTGIGGDDDSDEKTISTSIDLQKLNQTKESLTRGYNGFNVSLTWNYWMNDFSSKSVSKTYDFSWNKIDNVYYLIDQINRPDNKPTRNVTKLWVKAQWTSDNVLQVIAKVRVEARGAAWVYYETTATVTIKTVTFMNKNRWESQKKQLNENLSKNFNFVSNTSPKLDSEETKSIVDDKIVTSNKKMIENHINETIKASLGEDYDEWTDKVKWSIEPINEQKIVFVKFKDNDGFDYVQKGTFPKEIKFNVDLKFDAEGISQKIKDVMEKVFVLETGTSPNISDKSTESSGGAVKSNYDRVFEEIDNRIKQIFKSQTDWMELLKISKNIDDAKNNVTVTFADKGDGHFIENGQWVKQIVMPVQVVLTKEYYEKDIKNRLLVEAGKILNPKSTNSNETMTDHPSYDNSSKTFTYHNEVNLTFTSQKGANEILEVNDIAVPVYNNIFRITLKDLRDTINNPDPKPTLYKVNISQNGQSKLKFEIAIDSVSNAIKFKWVGWHPVDDPNQPTYYEQYLLTQEKIKDGNGDLIDNPKYNELIDPDTGLINNYIFVKGKNKYPFALDPLDTEGTKIKPTDPDAEQRYLHGYIAEAQIANSGIFNLDIKDVENIDHIDRIQLNPENLTEIGKAETVDLKEVQFSEEGLWHYIIYQKNYVEKELNPKDIYNETTPATSGSTIHKLLYISNQVKDYGEDFLGLDFVKANPNVQKFWSSIQANHLKNFLAPKGVDSKTLELAKYENIVSFWYQYISNVESDKGTPPPLNYIYLDKLDIDTIKINRTEDAKAKEDIKYEIVQTISKVSMMAKYGEDYFITDSVNGKKDLKDLDLSDFLENKTEPKIVTLFVVAKDSSTILKGEKEFKVVNNKDFEKSKIYDLWNLAFDRQVYNFSETSLEDFKNKYINQFILNVLDEQVISEVKPIEYGTDFLFSDNGIDGQDIFQSEEANELISHFLENDNSMIVVTIYAKDESAKLLHSKQLIYVNNFDAPLPPKVKININTIFKKLELGELKDSDGNGYIDKIEIWNELVHLNHAELWPNLKFDEFILKINDLEDDRYSVIVSAKDTNENYQGTVTAYYSSEFEPNPEEPDPENPDDKENKKSFNKKDLAWIIPLSVIGTGIIGFGIYWIVRKVKTKKKRMK